MISETLERLQQNGAPLIDGTQVTFLWCGDRPPRVFGDFNGWEPDHGVELQPLSPGWWIQQMEFPRDAYLEYAYWLDGQRVADPLCRRRTNSGTGEWNHYFYMPGAAPSPLVRADRRIPAGKITKHVLHDSLRLANQKRTVYLYRPPTDEPCPLVVVFDGRDYYRRGKINHIVDHLIAEKKIRPVALALVDNAGVGRYVEYACNDSTVFFINNQVLPLARRELSLTDPGVDPYYLLGASMGGLMALYTALRLPQVFSTAISQAGAFSLNREDFSIYEMVERGAPSSVKVWMDVGKFDFLYDTNQRMYAALRQNGYEVKFVDYPGGHNYTSWRNHLAEGLVECLKPKGG